MKQLFIALLCIFSLISCFENKPLESAEHIPLDSIRHYYSIQLDEKDSMVQITFVSFHIADRDKRLSIPNVDKIKINEQIIKLEDNSYKINIPIQNIKNDFITITYFSSDTVFYSKRVKLPRFYSCKLDFNRNIFHDSIGVYFEPALNMFEELDVELKSKKIMHKRFSYTESIRNGISFKKNLAENYGIQNKSIPTIKLKKLYTEKYSAPVIIEIRTTTEIEKEIQDVPEFH